MKIEYDIGETREFVEVGYMACADIEEEEQRVALKTLLHLVSNRLQTAESDIATLRIGS